MGLTHYGFSVKPDCTVYKKENEGISGTDLAAAEFIIEFKSTSEGDFFDEAQKLLKDSSSAGSSLGQIATYVAIQMDSQYRTHTFVVFIIKDYARLMRWDRSAAIFSERIYYNTQRELLQFFDCYSRASPEVRGSDKYVSSPTSDEIAATRRTCDDLREKSLLVVSFPRDNNHSDPRRYVIASPEARPSLPIGRSTRTSVAYDVQRKKRVYMKDLWGVTSRVPEGDVYSILHDAGVKNIPRCIDSFDFGGDSHHETQIQSFLDQPWMPEEPPSTRRHQCLILGTVGKRLEEFSSSKELVRAVLAALVGMNLKSYVFIYQTLTYLL
jgi:hypothetical protein